MSAHSAQTANVGSRYVDKLVIVGVGLIGGSFALALREAGGVGEVVGVGRSQANLDAAVALSIADRCMTLDHDWTQELANADLVFLSTPVAQFGPLLSAIAGRIGPRTIVTDAGSTKRDVIAAARAALCADELARFVPGHPLAGTEHSGAAAAFASLYRDRNVVLTPLTETAPAATAKVAILWEACGAHVRLLDPEAHDRILAAVSHLPHLLAFALVDSFAARPEADEILRLAASGFRDFTRIAASSPPMWRDIALANRDALLAELTAFRAQLDRVAEMLARGDGAALEAVFGRARQARVEWASRQHPGTSDASASSPRFP